MTIPTNHDLDQAQYSMPVNSQPSDETMECALFGSSVLEVRTARRNGKLLLDALDRERSEILSTATDDQLEKVLAIVQGAEMPSDPAVARVLEGLRRNILGDALVRDRVRKAIAFGREVGMAENHNDPVYEMACSRYSSEDVFRWPPMIWTFSITTGST